MEVTAIVVGVVKQVCERYTRGMREVCERYTRGMTAEEETMAVAKTAVAKLEEVRAAEAMVAVVKEVRTMGVVATEAAVGVVVTVEEVDAQMTRPDW